MSNEILTRIFVTKEGILYPIKGTFDNRGYIAKMTYFEPLKYDGEKPEFLEKGENKLNTTAWNKLISEREEYIDKEKGNLRIKIELPPIVETLLEEKESITLQTDGTDIILIKELKGLNKELYNIVAIDDLNYVETNLHYKDCGTNFVNQMPYKKEINYLLEYIMSELFQDTFQDKYKEIMDIQIVEPKDAIKAINSSGRTLFAISSDNSDHSYTFEDVTDFKEIIKSIK